MPSQNTDHGNQHFGPLPWGAPELPHNRGKFIDVEIYGDISIYGKININSITITGDQLFRGQDVYFTSSGNFDPDDYPGLKAVRFCALGGGGSGGGALATGVGEASCGGGGEPGAYGETGHIDVATLKTLDDPVEITIGAGMVGVVGDKGTGSNSTIVGPIGSPIIRALGGVSGHVMPVGSSVDYVAGGNPGALVDGSHWEIRMTTSGGSHGFRFSAERVIGGEGGSPTRWGSGAFSNSNGLGNSGWSPAGYGSGGSGAMNRPSQAARAGGDGAPGLVAVELYY